MLPFASQLLILFATFFPITMHFQQLLLAAASFGFLSLTAANPIPIDDEISTLPDGGYHVQAFPNGTTIYTNLEDDAAPITLHQAARSLKARNAAVGLEKRRTDCWARQLNVQDTDGATQGLRNWADKGTTFTSWARGSEWISVFVGNVQVYYCIIKPNSRGNLDTNDVNYALAQMDAKCRRYEASWYQWHVGLCFVREVMLRLMTNFVMIGMGVLRLLGRHIRMMSFVFVTGAFRLEEDWGESKSVLWLCGVIYV